MTDVLGRRMKRGSAIIFLMGPTASGKTDLAVNLAAEFNLEIVSVDSAMVYRGLDIGSGKPDAATLAKAPHRLIDIREPHEPYSVAQFRDDALHAIEQIHAAGRTPLLVGGTSLYFRALSKGLSPLPPADTRIRARLQQQQREHGLLALHQRLQVLDPVAAARIHATDPQRIQRALEVIEITGLSLSELHARDSGQQCPYPIISFSIEPRERSWLHERIARRFHAMLAQGFEQEVRSLRRRFDLSPDLPAVRAVGYRQMHEYLDKLGARDIDGDDNAQRDHAQDYAVMVEAAVVATRQLARRQLTWLRAEQVQQRLPADADDVEQQLRRAFSAALH